MCWIATRCVQRVSRGIPTVRSRRTPPSGRGGRSSRFVMGSMKHSELVKKAGIEAGDTTVGGIIRRTGNKLVTNEQSGTYWRNWTPEIRTKFRDFLNENGLSVEHFD